MLSIQELLAALERCMKAEPPVNYVLSPDASQLGGAWAEMLFERLDVRPLADLSAKAQAAFRRWG